MSRQHDAGGQGNIEDNGPVDMKEHPNEPWAKTPQAIFNVMRGKGFVTLHQQRRAVEDLPLEIYNTDYFERRTTAMCGLFEELGFVTRDEIEERMAEIRNRRVGAS